MEFWAKPLEANVTIFLLVSLLATLLIKAVIQRWKNKKLHKFMDSVPGPPCIPFFGNAYFALGITCENLCHVLRNQLDKYPNGGYWIGNEAWLITGDRKVLNALLSSNKNITKTDRYTFFEAHGAGIFCANGDNWRKIRNIVNPSFRTNVLASFGDSFSHHSKTFINQLEKYADSGEETDLFVPVHLCTIDFICENMMGCRMEVQKKNLAYLSTNLEKSSEMIFARMFNVLLQPDMLYSLIGKKKTLKELAAGMRSLAEEMVELRTKYREALKNSNQKTDSLQIFMESLLNNVESGIISKDRAVDETVEMFIAGSITTATTAAWVFKLFTMRPDVQEKVYQEIMEICAGRDITLDDVSKFEYLEMVVKETLRHFGIPFIGRHLVEDLPVDEKTTIPAGVRVLPILFTLHHNPEYWQRPNEFYPEHFLPIHELKRPKGAFVPFLTGPRHCPGNKYALQSVKYIVSSTLRHYTFLSDGTSSENFLSADYRILFMLWPVSGFRVKIQRRNANTRYTRAG